MKLPRLKLFDYLILVFSICIILLFSAAAGKELEGEAVLKISADEEYIYPMDEDAEITVSGPIGETHIVISEGTAYFTESPCKNKLCILMGGISEPGQWAACMPNRVFISIEGGEADEEIDVISY